MKLKNKKILFISASFFNYEKQIIQELQSLGADVDFYDERPSNSLWSKGIIRVSPYFLQRKIKRYYHRILKNIQGKSYDYFLLIKGESIPFFFLKALQNQYPHLKKILYLYDTVEEYPKFKKLFPYFDNIYSFEINDVRQYQLNFRPLFYIASYATATQQQKFKYTVASISSAHTDRYTISEKLNTQLEKLGFNTFFYHYIPSKSIYYFKRLFDKNCKKFDLEKLNFQKLSHTEISEIYSQSFAVLDINKPFQLGLSLRVFEALASQKKLITTNHQIALYPFYHPQNILIVNRNNLQITPDFFQSNFEPLSIDFEKYYSLSSWLEDVFLETHRDYWQDILKNKL